MAFGNVIDVDEIETGIEKSGNTPARRLDDDAPGRRRLDVAGSDRCRGVDDHRRQRFVGDHRLDQPFGCDLAALVGPMPARPRVERVSSAALPSARKPSVATLLV